MTTNGSDKLLIDVTSRCEQPHLKAFMEKFAFISARVPSSVTTLNVPLLKHRDLNNQTKSVGEMFAE